MVNSQERSLSSNPSGIDSNSPGNWTIRNIDATGFYGSVNDISFSLGMFQFPQCVPDDNLTRIIDIDGASFSVVDPTLFKINGFYGDLSYPHYRPTEIVADNLLFSNYTSQNLVIVGLV